MTAFGDRSSELQARIDRIRENRDAGSRPPLHRHSGDRTDLTVRELQLLHLIADGYTYRQVAAEWFVEVSTVKTHAMHLLAKLEARNAAHAVAAGFRQGLLTV